MPCLGVILKVLGHDVDRLTVIDVRGHTHSDAYRQIAGVGRDAEHFIQSHSGPKEQPIVSSDDVSEAVSFLSAAGVNDANFTGLKKIVAVGVLRCRRAADHRQYQSKFFHGIDYTRFPRCAQGGGDKHITGDSMVMAHERQAVRQ